MSRNHAQSRLRTLAAALLHEEAMRFEVSGMLFVIIIQHPFFALSCTLKNGK